MSKITDGFQDLVVKRPAMAVAVIGALLGVILNLTAPQYKIMVGKQLVGLLQPFVMFYTILAVASVYSTRDKGNADYYMELAIIFASGYVLKESLGVDFPPNMYVYLTAPILATLGGAYWRARIRRIESGEKGHKDDSKKRSFVEAQVDKVLPKVLSVDAEKIFKNYIDLRGNIYLVSRHRIILQALLQIGIINSNVNKPRSCFFLSPLEPLYDATIPIPLGGRAPTAAPMTPPEQHMIQTNPLDPLALAAILRYIEDPVAVRNTFAANTTHELYVPADNTKNLERMVGILQDIETELIGADKEIRTRLFKNVREGERLTDIEVLDSHGHPNPDNAIKDVIRPQNLKGYAGLGKGDLNTILSTQDASRRVLKKLKDKIESISNLLEDLKDRCDDIERIAKSAGGNTNSLVYRLTSRKTSQITILYRSHPPAQPPVRMVLGNTEIPKLRKFFDPDTGILDPLNTLKNRLEEAKLV